MKTLTVIMVVTNLSICDDGEETVEEMLANLDYTEEELVQKLNARHKVLFNEELKIDEGLVQFIVDFKETGERKRSEITEPMSEEKLKENLDKILKTYTESIKKGEFGEAVAEMEPWVKKYITEQILHNNVGTEELGLSIIYDSVIKEIFDQSKARLDRELNQSITKQAKADIESILKFINTDMYDTLAKSLAGTIALVVDNTNITEDAMKEQLKKSISLYEAIKRIQDTKAIDEFIDETTYASLVKGFKSIRKTENAQASTFLFRLMKHVASYFNEEKNQKPENKYTILKLLVEGLMTNKDWKGLMILEKKFFADFMERRVKKGELKINDLYFKNEDREQREQYIMSLFDYIYQLFFTGDAKDQEKVIIENVESIGDGEFKVLIDNIDTFANLHRRFYTGPTIHFPVFVYDGFVNGGETDFEHINTFYNFWIKFKTAKIAELTKGNVISLTDDYLNEIYNKNDENSFYPFDLSIHYGLFKSIIAYFSKAKEIKIEFKERKDVTAFQDYINQGDSVLKEFLITYFSNDEVVDSSHAAELKQLDKLEKPITIAPSNTLNLRRIDSTSSMDVSNIDSEREDESEILNGEKILDKSDLYDI